MTRPLLRLTAALICALLVAACSGEDDGGDSGDGAGRGASGDDEAAAPDGIRAIAAANSPERSGLFVADLAGRIYFHAAGAPVHERTKVDALVPRRSGIRPLGLAYGEPWLYVFDGSSRRVWAIDAWGDEPERPLALGAELSRPSHLAVSPHGVLAVVDAKKLIVQEAEETVKHFEITAPSDGYVLRTHVRKGETLGPNPRAPAIEFLPDAPIIIRAEVLQEWGRYVKAGAEVTIEDDTYKGPEWKGVVKKVGGWYATTRSPIIEPFRYNDVRTLECIIEVEKVGPEMRIGQRVRAKIKMIK